MEKPYLALNRSGLLERVLLTIWGAAIAFQAQLLAVAVFMVDYRGFILYGAIGLGFGVIMTCAYLSNHLYTKRMNKLIHF